MNTELNADPESAGDCLVHCRDLLTERDFNLACSLINLYASKQVLDAVNECSATILKALNEPLRSPEGDSAQ